MYPAEGDKEDAGERMSQGTWSVRSGLFCFVQGKMGAGVAAAGVPAPIFSWDKLCWLELID